MQDFLAQTDTEKQLNFTEIKLKRESFFMLESEQEKLEARSKQTGLDKTSILRIGLKMALDINNDLLYKENASLFKVKSGKRKAK